MPGIEAQHQAVEEAPPRAAAFGEETVHLRRQPHQGRDMRQLGLAFGPRAIDPQQPALAALARRVAPGADLKGAGSGDEAERQGPRPGGAAPVDLGELGAAQAAAGRQERNRLEQIGLARAIGPGQHDRAGIDGEPQLGIAAEIGKHEARHDRRARLAVCRRLGDAQFGGDSPQ